MSIQPLITLGVTLSNFLMVLTVGMRVVPADLTCVLSKPWSLGRSLFAINVLGPVIAVVVCKTFSLHHAVELGLVALAIAPVNALFSKDMLPLVAHGHEAFARGIFFASTVLSVILTPLAVEVLDLIFGAHVHVNPFTVGALVVSSVLLPLGIGLAISHSWPAAKQSIPRIQQVSALMLLICVVPILIAAWPLLAQVVWNGTFPAIISMALVGLATGHLLGGPDEDGRTVLAFATISRHPGVAIAIASLTEEKLAPVGVLLAVLVSGLAVVPYKVWRKRLQAPEVARPGQSRPSPRPH